ncbi:MAG TPA: hypothetical protein VMF63_12960 [Opitutaceae bacterium]|nr:hypothetical protein [Opitutaceae bacterium]
MNSPSVSQSSCGLGPRAWVSPTLWGLAAGLSAAAATVLFVLFKLPVPLRLVIALLPILPSLCYVGCVVRMFRQVDELQRRIQLEALGFAFPATAILVMAVDLLEQAKVLPAVHWGWSGLVVAMCLLWFAGWIRACRRYQ